MAARSGSRASRAAAPRSRSSCPSSRFREARMSSANILVVDDEDSIRHFVSRSLKDEGYHVRSAGDGDEARTMFGEDTPDVVILDMKLGDTNGLDLLSEFKQQAPDTIVIVITAFGETETAVRAM